MQPIGEPMLNHLTIELADSVSDDISDLERAMEILNKANLAGRHDAALSGMKGALTTLAIFNRMLNDGHLRVTGPIPAIKSKE